MNRRAFLLGSAAAVATVAALPAVPVAVTRLQATRVQMLSFEAYQRAVLYEMARTFAMPFEVIASEQQSAAFSRTRHLLNEWGGAPHRAVVNSLFDNHGEQQWLT